MNSAEKEYLFSFGFRADQLENQLFAPQPAIRETGDRRNRRDGRGQRANAAQARPKR